MAANFSDRVPLCFLADARLRSNMLFCPSVLPVPPAIRPFTELCRGTVGNLNDKLHSSILAVFRSRVRRTRGSRLVLSSDLEQFE